MKNGENNEFVTLEVNLVDHDVRQTRNRPLPGAFIPTHASHLRKRPEMLDAIEQPLKPWPAQPRDYLGQSTDKCLEDRRPPRDRARSSFGESTQPLADFGKRDSRPPAGPSTADLGQLFVGKL